MSEKISLVEKQFTTYLIKWYLGERIKFIKSDIKRNEELSCSFNSLEENNTYFLDDPTYECSQKEWVESIENKNLYHYTKNLNEKKKTLIYRNIILGESLTEVASMLKISKQLAYAYKKEYLSIAKKILEN